MIASFFKACSPNISKEINTLYLYPNVSDLHEEKRARVRQMWLRTGSVRTKRTSPYVEILAEASTAADGVLWRESSDFSRCRSETLGYTSLAPCLH